MSQLPESKTITFRLLLAFYEPIKIAEQAEIVLDKKYLGDRLLGCMVSELHSPHEMILKRGTSTAERCEREGKEERKKRYEGCRRGNTLRCRFVNSIGWRRSVNHLTRGINFNLENLFLWPKHSD
jgi:hypothetical protein